jgi:cardiolipin synthase A/B
MLWHELEALLPYAGALVEAFALLLVPWVLLRRHEPSSTIAWILTLIFLPGIGAALFLLHGRDRVRWPAKKKRAADAVVAARVRAARGRSSKVDLERELAPLRADERRIFRVCAELGPMNELSHDNEVELFADGRSAIEAMEAAIDAAESWVLAEHYLIRNDATGAAFRDKLAQAAARGVEVRLLVDAYGCFWLPRRFFRPLRRAGVKVAQFLPLRQALLLPMNLRNHRKIVVVDGRVAFTGGVNIGDEYAAASARKPAWRDTHVRIEGPAVASLTSVFLRDWQFMTGVGTVDDRFFPLPERAGSASVAVVPSGPDSTIEAIHRTFFAAIVGARHRAWITTPYFVPDRSLLVALQTSALRGVDVKILLPQKSNHRVTHAAAKSSYSELLEAGVELYEYLPAMIHAKTMLVDQHIALVGSANMDLRSFRLNFELHTLVHDAAVAGALEAAFISDLEHARRIALDEWRARPWLEKLGEGAARLVSPIL